MRCKSQIGASLVEFSVVILLFLTLVFAVFDVARLMFTLHGGTEATLYGARYSAICTTNSSTSTPGSASRAAVLNKMREWLPNLQDGDLNIEWYVLNNVGELEIGACDYKNCGGVQVSVVNYDFDWVLPIGPMAQPLVLTGPIFTSFYPREVMGQDTNMSCGQ